MVGLTFIAVTTMHVAAVASALSFICKFIHFSFQEDDSFLFWCALLPASGRGDHYIWGADPGNQVNRGQIGSLFVRLVFARDVIAKFVVVHGPVCLKDVIY